MEWVSQKSSYPSLDVLVEKSSLLLIRTPPSTQLPTEWLQEPLLFSLTKTPHETSLLLNIDAAADDFVSRAKDELRKLSDSSASSDLPEGFGVEGPWYPLRIRGPLDFGMIGVLSTLSTKLAQEAISIFVISTWDTDYVLVKDVHKAKAALQADGWQFSQ